LFDASSAVTVKLNAVPDAAVDGADMERRVTAPALTAIVPEAPVIDEVTVSAAVIVPPKPISP
jgi:hypothetical protein